MELLIRGRRLTENDLAQIHSLLAAHGHLGRSYVSRELCRRWQWLQPNGALKDSACRHLLVSLQTKGLLELAPRKGGSTRPRRQSQGQLVLPGLLPVQSLSHFPTAIQWRLAQAGGEALLYKDLTRTHHYLGYCREVGHCLRYVAYCDGRPIACVGWAAAAWKVAERDRLIGWNDRQRRQNLQLVVNNTRFLILPRLPHLASHLLAGNVRRLAADWKEVYGYSPALAETFVDTSRFKGTCYKAANWKFVGHTKGRGKYDRYSQRLETVKAVFLYPLDKNFKQLLTR